MTISDSYCMCSLNKECHIHVEQHPKEIYVHPKKKDKDET